MVFEKSLRVSTFVISSGEMTTGQITNHMSTDAMNIFTMAQYIIWMVTVPIQVRSCHQRRESQTLPSFTPVPFTAASPDLILHSHLCLSFIPLYPIPSVLSQAQP